MARFLAVALALLAGCDAEPYRVRFHLQLDAGRPVEDGAFVLTVHPEWAPLGEARFRELLREKFFDGARFFRVVPDFVVQWGLPASSETAALWEERTITDDPVLASNTRGTPHPHPPTLSLHQARGSLRGSRPHPPSHPPTLSPAPAPWFPEGQPL
eukprot:COSAG04_NODE_759_length_10538_cov_6.234218_5_plen_156_part_00